MFILFSFLFASLTLQWSFDSLFKKTLVFPDETYDGYLTSRTGEYFVQNDPSCMPVRFDITCTYGCHAYVMLDEQIEFYIATPYSEPGDFVDMISVHYRSSEPIIISPEPVGKPVEPSLEEKYFDELVGGIQVKLDPNEVYYILVFNSDYHVCTDFSISKFCFDPDQHHEVNRGPIAIAIFFMSLFLFVWCCLMIFLHLIVAFVTIFVFLLCFTVYVKLLTRNYGRRNHTPEEATVGNNNIDVNNDDGNNIIFTVPPLQVPQAMEELQNNHLLLPTQQIRSDTIFPTFLNEQYAGDPENLKNCE